MVFIVVSLTTERERHHKRKRRAGCIDIIGLTAKKRRKSKGNVQTKAQLKSYPEPSSGPNVTNLVDVQMQSIVDCVERISILDGEAGATNCNSLTENDQLPIAETAELIQEQRINIESENSAMCEHHMVQFTDETCNALPLGTAENIWILHCDSLNESIDAEKVRAMGNLIVNDVVIGPGEKVAELCDPHVLDKRINRAAILGNQGDGKIDEFNEKSESANRRRSINCFSVFIHKINR